jgi:hypothetical protein
MNDWEKLYDSVNKRQLGFVRHKNWGVGIVTKGDHQFLWVDFPCVDKMGHRVDLEFSRKILEVLPYSKCLVAAFDERSAEFKSRFSEHPVDTVLSLLVEAPVCELSSAQLRDQLRMIRHGLGLGKYADLAGFESWWKSLLRTLEADENILCPVKPTGNFTFIEAGTKHGAVYEEDANGNEVLVKACQGVEVVLKSKDGNGYPVVTKNGRRYVKRTRICFALNFIVPVIKASFNDVSVSEVLPDALQEWDTILLQRGVTVSAIESVADEELGQKAKELRRLAAQWRGPVASLTDMPSLLVSKMAAIGVRTSEHTADNWLRGRLKIAPQDENLKALAKLCADRGNPFDIKSCIKASSAVVLAHCNAGRGLVRHFKGKLSSILKDKHGNLQSGMVIAVGKREIVVDFYTVASVSPKLTAVKISDLNQVVDYDELLKER